MTDANTPDPSDARRQLVQFRDVFGHDIVAATAARERAARPRRRVAFAVATIATAAAVVVVASLPGPGNRDAPLLGASPAEAAVQELRDSLDSGVLVRVALNRQSAGPVEETEEADWTDLSTRERHTRIRRADATVEWWNPAIDERYTRDETLKARDGRQVISHEENTGSQNMSSSASPVEEINELLEGARKGKLTLERRPQSADGREVVVLERREGCYSTPDGGVAQCPDPAKPSAWPTDAPADMEPTTQFQTWWLETGDQPRLLRHENGFIRLGETKRHVMFQSRYTRWDVLPATDENLALVRPPAFPDDKFLVLDGTNAVGDAVRDGKVTCTGRYCPTN